MHELVSVPAVRRLLEKPEIAARARKLGISASELARRILAGEHADIMPLADRLKLEHVKDWGE